MRKMNLNTHHQCNPIISLMFNDLCDKLRKQKEEAETKSNSDNLEIETKQDDQDTNYNLH